MFAFALYHTLPEVPTYLGMYWWGGATEYILPYSVGMDHGWKAPVVRPHQERSIRLFHDSLHVLRTRQMTRLDTVTYTYG
jgi:hypothetical protein